MVKFLVPYELRVNAVAPGFVDTEWQKTKPAEIRRNIENKVSLGRFCDPDELAEVYKMLIENSYFNGEVVVVDGGYSYKFSAIPYRQTREPRHSHAVHRELRTSPCF